MQTNHIPYKAGVYVIENLVNRKKYVGSSINMRNRLDQHRARMRGQHDHENRILKNAWKKHGDESFICYVLEFCDLNDLTEREQFFIDVLNPYYNITRKVVRNILSKESRALQSATRKELFGSGKLTPNCAKKVWIYNYDGELLSIYRSFKQLEKAVGISINTIQKAVENPWVPMERHHFVISLKPLENWSWWTSYPYYRYELNGTVYKVPTIFHLYLQGIIPKHMVQRLRNTVSKIPKYKTQQRHFIDLVKPGELLETL